MRIEGSFAPQDESHLQLMIDHIHLRADFISGFQIVPRNEFFGDRDGTRAAKPSLDIEFSSVEIGRIESSERRVRKNIDPEDFQIFTREIRQRHQTAHERRRGGDASGSCGHRENRLGKIPGWRRNLQLRFAGHHVDRGGERAIRAVIGDLGCEINRDSERDAQNIQGREQRMAAQVTKNVPAKNAKILSCHRDSLPRLNCRLVRRRKASSSRRANHEEIDSRE